MYTIMTREDVLFEIAKNLKNYHELTDYQREVDEFLQELVQTSFNVVAVASRDIFISPDDVCEILSNRKGYSFEQTIDEIINDERALRDLIEEYFYNRTFSPNEVEAFKVDNTKV